MGLFSHLFFSTMTIKRFRPFLPTHPTGDGITVASTLRSTLGSLQHGGDLAEMYGFTGDHVGTDAFGMRTFPP